MDYRGKKLKIILIQTEIIIVKIQLFKLNFLANDEKKGISSAHPKVAQKERKQNRTKILPQIDYSMMKCLKQKYF